METTYPTYDRELLAIHNVLDYWSYYVYGKLKTMIYMNHAALQHIL
jgi:hypothetical protein